jgi:hypothetical protein
MSRGLTRSASREELPLGGRGEPASLVQDLDLSEERRTVPERRVSDVDELVEQRLDRPVALGRMPGRQEDTLAVPCGQPGNVPRHTPPPAHAPAPGPGLIGEAPRPKPSGRPRGVGQRHPELCVDDRSLPCACSHSRRLSRGSCRHHRPRQRAYLRNQRVRSAMPMVLATRASRACSRSMSNRFTRTSLRGESHTDSLRSGSCPSVTEVRLINDRRQGLPSALGLALLLGLSLLLLTRAVLALRGIGSDRGTPADPATTIQGHRRPSTRRGPRAGGAGTRGQSRVLPKRMGASRRCCTGSSRRQMVPAERTWREPRRSR